MTQSCQAPKGRRWLARTAVTTLQIWLPAPDRDLEPKKEASRGDRDLLFRCTKTILLIVSDTDYPFPMNLSQAKNQGLVAEALNKGWCTSSFPHQSQQLWAASVWNLPQKNEDRTAESNWGSTASQISPRNWRHERIPNKEQSTLNQLDLRHFLNSRFIS